LKKGDEGGFEIASLAMTLSVSFSAPCYMSNYTKGEEDENRG
jgi:hypothetical protein